MAIMVFCFCFCFLIKADCTARGKWSKDPETKMSAMHYHQPVAWGKLDVAKYGQHSKDSDLEARVPGIDGKDGITFDLVPDQCRPSLRLALLLLYRNIGCKY